MMSEMSKQTPLVTKKGRPGKKVDESNFFDLMEQFYNRRCGEKCFYEKKEYYKRYSHIGSKYQAALDIDTISSNVPLEYEYKQSTTKSKDKKINRFLTSIKKLESDIQTLKSDIERNKKELIVIKTANELIKEKSKKINELNKEMIKIKKIEPISIENKVNELQEWIDKYVDDNEWKKVTGAIRKKRHKMKNSSKQLTLHGHTYNQLIYHKEKLGVETMDELLLEILELSREKLRTKVKVT